MDGKLNAYLKGILKFIMGSSSPVSIKEICTGLNDQEYFIASAVKNLEYLGLLEKSEDGHFILSSTATAYMAMSEIEQFAYEKEHPFVLYRDPDGNMTSVKPEEWDIE